MLISIKTEYEVIYLFSEKFLDTKIIKEELELIQEDFKKWEKDRKEYLKNHNIDLKEHKYQSDNISYGFNKYGKDNIFMQKRFKELQKQDKIINEYSTIRPHPKYTIEKRLEKFGLKILDTTNCNIQINLSLEKNLIKHNIK